MKNLPSLAPVGLPADFELLEPIGGSHCAAVWRAWQRGAKRAVALKLLAPLAAPGDSRRGGHLLWRFQREIEAAALQHHPNIARIYARGLADGRPWYAMEFVPGVPLDTPMFVAPEQAAGRIAEVDVNADAYALGIILYRLATKAWPFDETLPPLQLLAIIRDTDPRPPRAALPDLPRDMEAIILKAIAKQKAERYPSARALAEDVTRFLEGEPVRARTFGYVVRKRLRKHWRKVAVAAVISALSVTIALTYLNGRRRAVAQNALALKQAQELLNHIIFDMHGKLAAIGHPELLQDAVAKMSAFQWDANPDPGSRLDMRRFRALAAKLRAEMLIERREFRAAQGAMEDAAEAYDRLALDHPKEESFAIEAAEDHVAAGNTLLRMGNLDRAHLEATRALRSTESLPVPSGAVRLIRIKAHYLLALGLKKNGAFGVHWRQHGRTCPAGKAGDADAKGSKCGSRTPFDAERANFFKNLSATL